MHVCMYVTVCRYVGGWVSGWVAGWVGGSLPMALSHLPTGLQVGSATMMYVYKHIQNKLESRQTTL